jgi:hypothetical protein
MSSFISFSHAALSKVSLQLPSTQQVILPLPHTPLHPLESTFDPHSGILLTPMEHICRIIESGKHRESYTRECEA